METAELQASPAFLILDDKEVYEIAPNSVVNIGRLESNDVVLDDYKVSREHAVLKYVGTDFTLVDLASTHGTFLNGERIDRRSVGFGDRIQITNHELALVHELPSGSEHEPATTVRMARSLDRRLKFFGGLNDFSLITLVQFLSQEKQSGLLLLELGQTPGPRVYFQDGEIIHVEDGHDLAELLTRHHHEQSLFFYFHHETNFPARTILEPTPNYLMRLCQAHDQRQGEESWMEEEIPPLEESSPLLDPASAGSEAESAEFEAEPIPEANPAPIPVAPLPARPEMPKLAAVRTEPLLPIPRAVPIVNPLAQTARIKVSVRDFKK